MKKAAAIGFVLSLFWFPACKHQAHVQIPLTKVLLIGIDGATWEIMDRMIAEGRLPVFKKLVGGGVSAPLETLEPTVSPAIWTTIVTGKLPARHGIFGFDGVPGLTLRTLPTSQMRKTKALWNMVSDMGLTVGFVNWWCSWPAEAVNGFVVSDRATYNRMEATVNREAASPYDTYPQELMTEIGRFIEKPDSISYEEIREFMDLSDSEIAEVMLAGDYEMGNPFLEFKYVYQSDKAVEAIGDYLLADRRPDLMGVYFAGVDVVSHLYWHFMDPEPFRQHQVPENHLARFQHVIVRFYELMDRFVGQLLETARGEYTVCIVSDHGFGATGRLPWSGGHGKITPGAPVAPDGVLIMNGRGVRKGVRIDTAHVVDVLPTLLYLMGLPLGKDMEGEVLFQALEKKDRWKPAYIASYDTKFPVKNESGRMIGDPERDRALVNKLKSLGYIQ